MYQVVTPEVVDFFPSLEMLLKDLKIRFENWDESVEVHYLEMDWEQVIETKVCDVFKVNDGLRIEFSTRKFFIDIVSLPFSLIASWPSE
jgi:hypothetical protein